MNGGGTGYTRTMGCIKAMCSGAYTCSSMTLEVVSLHANWADATLSYVYLVDASRSSPLSSPATDIRASYLGFSARTCDVDAATRREFDSKKSKTRFAISGTYADQLILYTKL